MSHAWPDDFTKLKQEVQSAWHLKGDIDLIRELSGRSGATILQVDLETEAHKGMAILKISSAADEEEIKNHRLAESGAGDYSSKHFPKLVKEYTSPLGMALLFEVAGKSLHQVQPFVRLDHSQQLSAIGTVSRDLLETWNSNLTSRTGLHHPSELLREWLGNKIESGNRISGLLEASFQLPPHENAFSLSGEWLPNPIAYANSSLWETAEHLKVLSGHYHGDLHGGNVLVRVAGSDDIPYYLIDFSFYRPDSPLFFDHAYFEVSYLLAMRGDMHPARWIQLVGALEEGVNPPGGVAEDVGVMELVFEMREAVSTWIAQAQSDRTDHLTSQHRLARVAAGLNFASKRLENTNQCVLAYLYAAVALRSYLDTLAIPWEKKGPAVQRIAPAPPPSEDIWRKAWENCDQFDPSRNVYILLAGRCQTTDPSTLAVLGRIPWAVVLDFDPESKSSGLYAGASPTLATQRALREMLFDGIQDFNYQAATAWLFTGGVPERPDTLSADHKAWRRTYAPAIRSICEQLRDAAIPTAITVLIVPQNLDKQKLQSAWEAMDEVFGDHASYVVLGDTTELQDPSIVACSCSLDDFLRGLWLMFGVPESSAEVRIPARAPSDNSRISVALSSRDAGYIGEDITVVHSRLAVTSGADGPVGFSFWRGGEITWPELDMEADVRRECAKSLTLEIEDKLSKFPTSVIKLEHRPGAGGTTVARRLLWDMRDRHPSVAIHNLSEHTSNRLELLYHLTRLPLFIVAEAHTVPTAALDNMVRDLRTRNVRFAVCHVVRSMLSSARHTVPEPMGAEEATHFFNRYKGIAPAPRLPLLRALAEQDGLRRFRSPFFFGLYSFEEEFTHVSDYVRVHLADVPPLAINTVRSLALVSRFSQEGLLDAVVLKLLGLSERGTFRVSELFGPSFARLIRVDQRRAKIVHPLIAQEVLRQLEGDRWSAKLPDLSISFIDEIISVAGNKSSEALQLFANMFISRDFWGEAQGRRQFSELIQTIEKNDAGQHRVLQKLNTECPDQATFWNHLGRHHMYIMHSDYHLTEECLLKAIELEPNNSIHHHALGMAYRFEINRRLRAVDNRRSDAEAALRSIQEVFALAQGSFSRARDLAPSSPW